MIKVYYGKIFYTNKENHSLTSFSDSPIHIAYLIDNIISKNYKHVQSIEILSSFMEDEFLEYFKNEKNKNIIPFCFNENKINNTTITYILPFFVQYKEKSENELLKIYKGIPNCTPLFKRFLLSKNYESKIKNFMISKKYLTYLSKINNSRSEEVYHINNILSCKNNENLTLTKDFEYNSFNISNKYYENQIKNIVGNTWNAQINLIKLLQKQNNLQCCFYFNNKGESITLSFDNTNKKNILSSLYEIINASKQFNILNNLNCLLSIKQNTILDYKRFTIINFNSYGINKFNYSSTTEIDSIRTFINNTSHIKEKSKIIPTESHRFMKTMNFNLEYSNG